MFGYLVVLGQNVLWREDSQTVETFFPSGPNTKIVQKQVINIF